MAYETISMRSDEWSKNNLSECPADNAEYINQSADYADSTRGEWWSQDDERMIIYYGTFGNDHSPGSDLNTYAMIYDDQHEYDAMIRSLDAMPQSLKEDESEEMPRDEFGNYDPLGNF